MNPAVESILERNQELIAPPSLSFAERVWNTNMERYLKRLRAVQLDGLDRVLDAGCGFGQWSWALSLLNQRVEACDLASERLLLAQEIVKALEESAQIHFQYGALESLPYPKAYFEGLLCYEAIHASSWRESLAEFSRVLRPSGRAYITANGLGWYLRYFLEQPRREPGHDPRMIAAQALLNTVNYERNQPITAQGQIIQPDLLAQEAESLGFRVLGQGPEGSLDPGKAEPDPFFQASYHGHIGVHEILLERL